MHERKKKKKTDKVKMRKEKKTINGPKSIMAENNQNHKKRKKEIWYTKQNS